jgi:hypothetical protein
MKTLCAALLICSLAVIGCQGNTTSSKKVETKKVETTPGTTPDSGTKTETKTETKSESKPNP